MRAARRGTVALDDGDLLAALGEDRRRNQAGRARADDDDVDLHSPGSAADPDSDATMCATVASEVDVEQLEDVAVGVLAVDEAPGESPPIDLTGKRSAAAGGASTRAAPSSRSRR